MSYHNNYNNNNNYNNINNTNDYQNNWMLQRGGANFPVADEIHFWGRQLMEHSLFLFLGLEKTDLKKEAHKNYKHWEEFMNQYFWDKGIIASPTTIMITDQSAYSDSMVSVNPTLKLIDQTMNFITGIATILSTSEWIGWIFPSLVDHMIKETIYFRQKLTDDLLPENEIKFINDHHSEEMGATAQLIDPALEQQPIIDIARSYVLKCMSKIKSGISLTDAKNNEFPKQWTPDEELLLTGLSFTDQATFLRLSIKFSRELTEFADDTGKKIETGTLKTVISPVLAHHVHREFARFTMRLEMLQ